MVSGPHHSGAVMTPLCVLRAGMRETMRQSFQRRPMAVIIEAVAVDDRAILQKSEGARAIVAGLCQRRQRADFDEAEALPQHGVGNFGVLVEARRETHRIGEVETERLDRKARIVRLRRARRQEFQRGDCGAMRVLGVKEAQDGKGETEGIDHRSPEKSWRPSGRSGRGATRVTASSESGA